MSPVVIGLIGIGILLLFMSTGMWIGIVMTLVGIVGTAMILGWDRAMTLTGLIPFSQLSFYPMSVAPMFMLMGIVISYAGIGTELYKTAHAWLGQYRGGLASATVAATAMLAAITGSSNTGIMIMAKVALPEMKKFNYNEALSSASIASSSTLGILIPPSLPFVMYGILTENSIGKLFMAGVLPGLLQAFMYIALITVLCYFKPGWGPAGPKVGWKGKFTSLRYTWQMLLLFVLVMGGIYGGIFTPTEAGAIGAFGAIVIGVVMRKLDGKKIQKSVYDTAVMTGMIMLMIGGTFIFMSFMAISRLPMVVSDWLTALPLAPWMIMACIIVMYLILGSALPELPLVMLTIPTLYPAVIALGFDPIWYGVLLVRIMMVGSLSPPFAINVFVLSGLTGINMGTIYRGVWWFMACDVIHIAILIAFPWISLYLPSLMK